MSASLRLALLHRASCQLVTSRTPHTFIRHGRTISLLSNARSHLDNAASRTWQTQLSASTPASAHLNSIARRWISYKDLRSEQSAQKKTPRQARPSAKADAKSPTPNTNADQSANQELAIDEAERIYQSTRSESSAAEEAQARARAQQEDANAQHDEAKGDDADAQQKAKADASPEAPRHGAKTPWQVFTETLQTEFKASKDWNEGTKQLSGSINDFTQNPNVQKARSAYTKATDTATSASSAALKSTAGAIGSSAAWAWDTTVVKGIRTGTNAVGSGLEKATRPLRETEAYKNVQDTIDDGTSTRYGGWLEKEERQRRREARERKYGKLRPTGPVEADPNAGTNVTLHKDAKWKESWREFKESSGLMQRVFSLKSTYNDSENPLISTARSISDRVSGWFSESETAMVVKKFREMDPSFQLEEFLQELREYILPEVLDAYVKGDVETLNLWLSAAQFQVYSALMHQYTSHGLKSDGKILDIRNVDVLNARLLDPGEIPVFVIMCRTQEVHVYRNAKTGDLASGMEDKVQQVTYAIGMTREPEDVYNPETRGWRMIELQKSGRDYL